MEPKTRFKFIGSAPVVVQLSNVFGPLNVSPGETFEVPSRWAYAIQSRGMPVELAPEIQDEASKPVAEEECLPKRRRQKSGTS